MKRSIIILFASLLFASTLFGQAPFAFNYQAVVKTPGGSPLADRNVALLISLVSGFEDGPLAYQEEHRLTTTEDGMINIQIGLGNILFSNLRNIDWGSNSFYMRLEIDPLGAENYQELETVRLYSVPFALYAQTAGSSNSGSMGTDDQQIHFADGILQIEDGNSVDLSSLREDADADPENEVQNLSIQGNQLSISQGNSIDLSSISSQSVWESDGNGNIEFDGTTIKFNTLNGQDAIFFGQSPTRGSGIMEIRQNNGISVMKLSTTTTNNGFLEIENAQGEKLVRVTSAGEAGSLTTYGPNGNSNILLTSLSDDANNGFLVVRDDEGAQQAGLFVNGNGDGVIFADVKNFAVDFPDDDDLQIVYASLEGPEAAAYIRGSHQLQMGEANIEFPEHFQHIVNGSTMTIMITPLSAESKGIAVVTKSDGGFRVKELFGGTGSYDFDWEVKGVRKGHEEYRVIREKVRFNKIDDLRN